MGLLPPGRASREPRLDAQMTGTSYQEQWDAYFVSAVRSAARAAFDRCAYRAPHEVYLVLSEELERRGIEPERDAVYEASWLISEGRKPAVLRTGTHG